MAQQSTSSRTVRLERRPRSAQVSSNSRPARSSIGENSRTIVQNVPADSTAEEIGGPTQRSVVPSHARTVRETDTKTVFPSLISGFITRIDGAVAKRLVCVMRDGSAPTAARSNESIEFLDSTG